MKITLPLYEREQIQKFLCEDLIENIDLILGSKELSRFFTFSFDECMAYALELSEKGYTCFLQWDILMTESQFQGLFQTLKNKKLFTNYPQIKGIRVQDAGALYALKNMSYTGEVHLICEQGNHNTSGLLSWFNTFPQGIKRLVVSPEYPALLLKNLVRDLPVPIEYLGAGSLLIFYTPRNLVSPLYDEGDKSDEGYRVWGTSEESPHKGFPIIENGHGTFMFNTKDQYIFDEVDLLKEEDEKIYWRLDSLWHVKNFDLFSCVKNLLKERNFSSDTYKEQSGRPVTKGFFRVNKTDVLFKKLKNSRLQDRNEDYLGEVVDTVKKGHVALLIKSEKHALKIGDEINFLSPEGRTKSLVVTKMWDLLKRDIEVAEKGQIVFLRPVGGVSVRTMVFMGGTLKE